MPSYQKATTEEDLSAVSNNNHDQVVVAVASQQQPALPFLKRVVAVVASGTAVVALLSRSGMTHSAASVSPFAPTASLMRSVNGNGNGNGNGFSSGEKKYEKCSIPVSRWENTICALGTSKTLDGHKFCWSTCSTNIAGCPEDFYPVSDKNCVEQCDSYYEVSYLCSNQARYQGKQP